MNKLVHVAVGVILDPHGKILIAKRPQAAHQGGLWEFPGGKVDAGESVTSALERELMEELSIRVISVKPLIQIRHHYPDKYVLLDAYKVLGFTGMPLGVEGQPIKWVSSPELSHHEFPAANKPIITAILLPDRYLITGKFFDDDDFIHRLKSAFEHGIRLVQIRMAGVELSNQVKLLNRIFSIAKAHSVAIVLNTELATFEQVQQAFPDAKVGLHLTSERAIATQARPIPINSLFGVSCHNEEEIRHAQTIGADYLLLSPVKVTASHPEASPLGWEKFKQLIELANIPTYALGGVGDGDLEIARSCGAQGVAGISAWW